MDDDTLKFLQDVAKLADASMDDTVSVILAMHIIRETAQNDVAVPG